MGRPSKRIKRERQLNLKLTEREFAWILLKAADARMRPGEFGRAQLFATGKVGKSTANKTHLDPLFLSQVGRIGNNLNQIARRLHEFHLPAPQELDDVLALIREVIRKASAHDP
jgi:hypothetical protein